MIKRSLSLVFAILLGNISLVRADGESLPKQLQQIESLQRRADKLAFGELGADNYHLAKARTWLDLARSEYYDNEKNGIIPDAIGQAKTLLIALEKKQPDITMDTPVQITDSEAVRPDLWDKIATLKNHVKFSCGQRSVAEAEVHLVWGGHIKLESSWRHAESYTNRAEELLNEALNSINDCVAQMTAIVNITLSSDVFFVFSVARLEPPALRNLDKLANSIKMATTLEEVVLVGHADRIGIDKYPQRSQLVSEQRAESAKRYLVSKGIPADKIHTSGAGSSQPLVQCSTNLSREKQIDCLQPNRRVQIILRGKK